MILLLAICLLAITITVAPWAMLGLVSAAAVALLIWLIVIGWNYEEG